MAAGFPLGTFTRGRRDWALSELMMCGAQNQGGSGIQVRYSLVNNSKNGNWLACYGILFYRSYSHKLVNALIIPGADAAPGVANYPFAVPLIFTAAAIDGAIGMSSGGGFGAPYTQQFQWWADGTRWLTFGDLPLAVIPPGQQLTVANGLVNQGPVSGELTTCAFVWGYYVGAKPPSKGTV